MVMFDLKELCLKFCLLLLAASFGLMKSTLPLLADPASLRLLGKIQRNKKKKDKEILGFVGTASLLPVVHCLKAQFSCAFK